MMPQIADLLRPLKEAEKTRIPLALGRLFQTEDFQLVFRYMNQICNGIASTSFDGKVEDAYKAAWRDGSKCVPRQLLQDFISVADETEKKPLIQETNDTP